MHVLVSILFTQLFSDYRKQLSYSVHVHVCTISCGHSVHVHNVLLFHNMRVAVSHITKVIVPTMFAYMQHF